MKEELIKWVQETVGNATVVIGISGGKDSSVVAALCVAALGKDRVVGVLMPDGKQHDIDKSYELVNFLGIKYYLIDIAEITEASRESIRRTVGPELTYQLRSNLAARIRMTTLYNVAAMIGNCRVANTCNYSEDYVGYSTKYGDSAGDFAPIQNLLVREVKALGYELGLPKDLIEKVPEDGLSGKTDEDNFGFTYNQLDDYLETGKGDPALIEKIEKMHRANLHKLRLMPKFGNRE
ncbi:MAG: NAD(+) synthase [Bacilli bacterium]|nr:NAD(+) synthase [Bacilli bacterium]